MVRLVFSWFGWFLSGVSNYPIGAVLSFAGFRCSWFRLISLMSGMPGWFTIFLSLSMRCFFPAVISLSSRISVMCLSCLQAFFLPLIFIVWYFFTFPWRGFCKAFPFPISRILFDILAVLLRCYWLWAFFRLSIWSLLVWKSVFLKQSYGPLSKSWRLYDTCRIFVRIYFCHMTELAWIQFQSFIVVSSW